MAARDAAPHPAPIGRLRWAVSAGCIPTDSTGPEPEFTSRDVFAILNANDAIAHVRVRVVYATREIVGPFRVAVARQRMRQLRVNDLIFPEAVRLGEAYSLVFDSDVPVVVQFGRCDTRQAANAGFMAMAFACG